MEIPKRTESRPPRPPVPKFRLIGAGTDTPDFLPPPKSESSLIALSQDNTSETSSEESHDSFFARKRLLAITEEVIKQQTQLNIDEDVLKQALRFLKPDLLEQLKSKKYDAIAVAVIIAAIKRTCKPITLKEMLSHTTVSEKQIKKILIIIGNHEQLNPTVEAFIKSICEILKLNQNFQNLCQTLFRILQKLNLIQGEHENIIAAAIVKYCGDWVFQERGGIITQLIADQAKCSAYSLRIMHKKFQDNKERIFAEFQG